MAERFVKEHLRADEVIGSELVISRFGFATGFVKGNIVDSYISSRVAKLFIDEKPCLGQGRVTSSFLSLCKVSISNLKLM
jgi:glycerol-3-phosphate acyltransferase